MHVLLERQVDGQLELPAGLGRQRADGRRRVDDAPLGVHLHVAGAVLAGQLQLVLLLHSRLADQPPLPVAGLLVLRELQLLLGDLGHVADHVADGRPRRVVALRPLHHQEVGEGRAALLDGGGLRVGGAVGDLQQVVRAPVALPHQLFHILFREPQKGHQVAKGGADDAGVAREHGDGVGGQAGGHHLAVAVHDGAARRGDHDGPQPVLLRADGELLSAHHLRLEERGEQDAQHEGYGEHGRQRTLLAHVRWDQLHGCTRVDRGAVCPVPDAAREGRSGE